jgi:restriction endonuclease
MTVPINHAFYVKLGVGGCWEDDSLANACIRVGFSHQNVADINTGNWAKIKKQLDAGKKQSVATADLNRLRELTASVRGDVWVTFHEGRMWWTRVVPGPVRQDKLSKYRKTQPWRDRDEQGKLLVSTGLPGKIASVQAYRRTICSIEDRALLRRVLEGTRGEVAIRIAQERSELEVAVLAAIRELHWKDFETLVDLVFRHAGWARTSILGQQVKSFDLELTEPLTRDRYVVQVKAKAGRRELDETIRAFSDEAYRRVFFVVHTPKTDLANVTDVPDFVEIVDPALLARMAVAAGLTGWVEDKTA